MRFVLFMLAMSLATKVFSQESETDEYLQNFYQSCKANKYSAFAAGLKTVQMIETGQYERAIRNSDKALAIDSSYCDAYYLLAFCYQQQQQYDKAIRLCDKSIGLNMNNPSAWTIKGSTLLMMGDNANALICFENAKKYAPNQADGYYGLALSYYQQQKSTEALAILNELDKRKEKSVTIPDNRKLKKLRKKLEFN